MSPPPRSATAPAPGDDSRKWVRVFSILMAMGAFAWCINTAVMGTISMISLKDRVGQWISAEALVVGSNYTDTTNAGGRAGSPSFYDLGSFGSATPYRPYCTMVKFQIDDEDEHNNATTVIMTTIRSYCSKSPSRGIDIGGRFEILYNPSDPMEIVPSEVYDDSLSSLGIAIAVAIVFSLCFFSCVLVLWKKQLAPLDLSYRNAARRRLVVVAPLEEGEVDLEMQQIREQKMLDQFLFQTVLEDMSNTSAAKIRSSTITGTTDLEQCGADTTTTNQAEEGNGESALDARNDTYNHNCSTNSTAMEESSSKSQQQNLQKSEEATAASSYSTATECCICMEHYIVGETICVAKTAKCGHVFHKTCISAWLVHKNHDGCPLCRIDVMQ